MKFIVIYFNPSDYKDLYVAREFKVLPGEVIPQEIVAIEKTLEEIRKHIPSGMTCMGRFDNDDPVVVETWF